MSQAHYPQRKSPWKSLHCGPIKARESHINALGAGHECGRIGTIVRRHSAPVATLIISGDHHLLDLGCFAEMPIVTVAEAVWRMGLLA